MTNVQKLALDFAMRWFLPIQLILSVIIDFFYVIHPSAGASYVAGILLAFQQTFPVTKIALWRTLPVSRAQIGRARWWQMVGIPAIALVGAMALALAAAQLAQFLGLAIATHRPHADTLQILGCLAGQFLYPVALTIVALTAIIFRTRRIPMGLLVVVLVLLPVFMIAQGLWNLSLQTRLQIFELISLPASIILYLTAPRWPLPSLQPLQFGTSGKSARATGAPGSGGWIDLIGLLGLRVVSFTAGLYALWGIVMVVLNVRHLPPLTFLQFTPAMVIATASGFNSAALRVLRAVPATGLQLALYLLWLPLVVLALACLAIMLVLEPLLLHVPATVDMPQLLVTLMVGALLTPLALRLNQMWLGLLVPISILPTVLMQIGWRLLPAPWHDVRLVGMATLLTITAAQIWMYRQVTSGTRVYRFQPAISPRWRGGD